MNEPQPLVLERGTYSLDEAAALLGQSVRTVRRRCADGTLPYIQLVPGGRVTIPRAAVDALVQGGHHGTGEHQAQGGQAWQVVPGPR